MNSKRHIAGSIGNEFSLTVSNSKVVIISFVLDIGAERKGKIKLSI